MVDFTSDVIKKMMLKRLKKTIFLNIKQANLPFPQQGWLNLPE
jgi:hypothetical protein